MAVATELRAGLVASPPVEERGRLYLELARHRLALTVANTV